MFIVAAGGGPSVVISSPRCSISPAKITYVLIVGQQGTEIRDETSKNDDSENLPSTNVTLYESSVNILRIQLDCGQQNDDDYSCSRVYQIHALIDLNDNGKFDEVENRIHHRSLIHSEKAQGTYDLEISIPLIDGTNTKAGSHRMRLSLMPTEEYRKKCGKTDYSETRQYKVNIIQKPICQGKIIFLEKKIQYLIVHILFIRVVSGISRSVVINKFICSPNVGKIQLILIGGELGTQIRDTTGTNVEYEKRNQHDITLFGDAVYLLRLQFECPRKSGTDLIETDCTPAHHADIYIDLNDDGKFDESENRVYRRTRIDDETPEYTFDLQILIPPIDAINIKAGIHKMRVKLIRSEPYQKQCGKNEHSEIREYMVNIIQRKRCPGNICSTRSVFSLSLLDLMTYYWFI